MKARGVFGLWAVVISAQASQYATVEFREANAARTGIMAADVVVKAGCTTAPTPVGGQGQECALQAPYCVTIPSGAKSLSQRTLERKFVVIKGPNAECNYSPSNFVSKYGVGSPLVEPKTFCVQIHASSRGGFLNIGDQGQVECEFHINYDSELWP